jgi:hypothetical protein
MAEAAPLFRVLCGRVGTTDLDSIFIRPPPCPGDPRKRRGACSRIPAAIVRSAHASKTREAWGSLICKGPSRNQSWDSPRADGHCAQSIRRAPRVARPRSSPSNFPGSKVSQTDVFHPFLLVSGDSLFPVTRRRRSSFGDRKIDSYSFIRSRTIDVSLYLR